MSEKPTIAGARPARTTDDLSRGPAGAGDPAALRAARTEAAQHAALDAAWAARALGRPEITDETGAPVALTEAADRWDSVSVAVRVGTETVAFRPLGPSVFSVFLRE